MKHACRRILYWGDSESVSPTSSLKPKTKKAPIYQMIKVFMQPHYGFHWKIHDRYFCRCAVASFMCALERIICYVGLLNSNYNDLNGLLINMRLVDSCLKWTTTSRAEKSQVKSSPRVNNGNILISGWTVPLM